MPRKKIDLNTVSLAELKALVAQKEALAPLEKRRAEILKEMANIDAELKRIAAGKSVRKKAGRKATGSTTARKRPGRKKKVAKKAGALKLTVEQAAVQVIQTRGKPTAFQDILSTILEFRLVKTKSKNFANVLRRTLATSKAVTRTGRGVYGKA